MSLRRSLVLALAGVLVGVVAWSLAQLGGTDSTASGGPSGIGSTAVLPAASPGVAVSQGAVPDGDAPSVPVRTDAAGDDPAAGAVPTRGATGAPPVATEILPTPASSPRGQVGLPGLRPARSTTAPLVTAPLPARASGKGRLVAGYPRVLAPPAGHTIVLSSLAPADTVLQASLTASCSRPCAVLRRYRLRLAARGFTEVTTPSLEHRPTASFRRGEDSVTVTITARDASTIAYAVFAVLHTARA